MSFAVAHRSEESSSAVRTDLGAIFVSMELSQSKWLLTSLSPGNGEKLSNFMMPAGDVAGMLARLTDLQRKAQSRTGQSFPLIVIQEAGLDGFWIPRCGRWARGRRAPRPPGRRPRMAYSLSPTPERAGSLAAAAK